MEHAIQGLPLVQAYRVPDKHYLLPSPPPQEILPIEPISAIFLFIIKYQNRKKTNRGSTRSIHGCYKPWEVASTGLPPVFEVQAIGAAILLAVELGVDERARG